jgi:hypothetical protein
MANNVCAGFDSEIKKIGPPASQSEMVGGLSTYAGAMLLMDRQLGSIPAPEPDAGQIREMLDLWDQAAAHVEAAASAAQAGETQSFHNALQLYGDPNSRGNQIAYNLGASRCADMGSGSGVFG